MAVSQQVVQHNFLVKTRLIARNTFQASASKHNTVRL